MDIEKLRTFITVAQLGSFSAAADELYLTASAVSKHIAALESELGVSLFKRTPKKIFLSNEGEVCLAYAERIVSEYNGLISSINSFSKLTVLSIPLQSTILPIISRFSTAYPSISVSVEERHGLSIVKSVENGEYELGFAGSIYSKSPLLDRHMLTKERIGVIVPTSHPLAARETVSVSELRDEQFLMIVPESGLYKAHTDICLEHGFEPNISAVSSREDTIISLVSLSRGIAFISELEIASYSHSGVSFIMLEEEYYSNSCLLRAKGRQLSQAALRLWDFVVKNY